MLSTTAHMLIKLSYVSELMHTDSVNQKHLFSRMQIYM